MENYTIGKNVTVVDISDGKHRKCRIMQIDLQDQEIMIHYNGWNERYDEWLSIDSDRIVKTTDDKEHEEDNDPPACNSSDQKSKEIIGMLLNKGSETAKKVISAYELNSSYQKNDKNLSKYSIPMLEECAELFHIKMHDSNGKKLLNKKKLVSIIIMKIDSLLPTKCTECSATYCVELNEDPLFTCNRCCKGSHDCKSFQETRSTLPKKLPKGFVWLCGQCYDEICYKDLSIEVKTLTSNIPILIQEEVEKTLEESNVQVVDVPKEVPTNYIKDLCRKYKKGLCPHGIRGNKIVDGQKCIYNHPKPCKRYCSYGSRENEGCQRGKECKFFHPTLCKFSLSKRLCTNKMCKFVHIKGTARKVKENLDLYHGKQGPNARTNIPPSRGGDSDRLTDPFLRLEEMIKGL